MRSGIRENSRKNRTDRAQRARDLRCAQRSLRSCNDLRRAVRRFRAPNEQDIFKNPGKNAENRSKFYNNTVLYYFDLFILCILTRQKIVSRQHRLLPLQ